MSDITLPHPTFTDGNVLTADDVWENLYTTEAVPNSYEVINGSLELANVVAPTANSITTQMIQKGSMSAGKGVGATANVDYFPEPFSDWDQAGTNDSGDIDGLYTAVPGASIEFYLPYAPSVLLLTWQITTRVELASGGGTYPGRLRLFLDGARVSNNVYQDIPYQNGPVSGGRPWHAHYMKIGGITKGWHSVSLRIAADSVAANQVRVLTRNMNYVYFQ